ncbi:MAG: dihydroneopterin aldolase [Bacillales bacterium]|jgi:protein-disulfide isomerase|nr:dihydroneopterin aldolase [Bacillales bacterium]
MNSKGRIFAVIIGIIAIVGVFFVFNYTPEPDKENKKGINVEGQPTIGDKNAKVQIVEMGDIMCPACKVWSLQYFPAIKERFIDTGMANFSFVNVLFHGDASMVGAQAFEAVYELYPDHYWEYVHNLYAKQPESANHDQIWINSEVVADVGEATIPNFDREAFLAKMKSPEVNERINKDDSIVKESGLQLTPGIFINGVELTDPFDSDKIIELIEEGQK